MVLIIQELTGDEYTGMQFIHFAKVMLVVQFQVKNDSTGASPGSPARVLIRRKYVAVTVRSLCPYQFIQETAKSV